MFRRVCNGPMCPVGTAPTPALTGVSRCLSITAPSSDTRLVMPPCEPKSYRPGVPKGMPTIMPASTCASSITALSSPAGTERAGAGGSLQAVRSCVAG